MPFPFAEYQMMQCAECGSVYRTDDIAEEPPACIDCDATAYIPFDPAREAAQPVPPGAEGELTLALNNPLNLLEDFISDYFEKEEAFDSYDRLDYRVAQALVCLAANGVDVKHWVLTPEEYNKQRNQHTT